MLVDYQDAMKLSTALVTLALATRSLAGHHDEHVKCTLSASGGDDAPAFVKAVKACPVVTIPKSETLLINTRLNTTGLVNKKIVSMCHFLTRIYLFCEIESSRNAEIQPRPRLLGRGT